MAARMEIAAAPRSGTVAATLRDAVVQRDGFRLGPVSLQVNWADRIAITGPNGSGKSTLIAALLGACHSPRARRPSALACTSARSTKPVPCSATRYH